MICALLYEWHTFEKQSTVTDRQKHISNVTVRNITQNESGL